MSEQEVLSRIRSLPGVVVSTSTTPPRVTARVEGAVERAERDLLREVAYTKGLDVLEIQPCYFSRVTYDWCLALLGLADRPPYPFPLELAELLLRLLVAGKVDAGQVRRLGLEWFLAEVVAGRVESVLRSIIRGVQAPAEVEVSLMRLIQTVRTASKVVEPTVLERKIAEVAGRVVGPRTEETVRALISAIRGEISPARAVEEVVSAVSSRRLVTPAQEAERMEIARAVPPREEIGVRRALLRGG